MLAAFEGGGDIAGGGVVVGGMEEGGHIVGRQIIFAANVALTVIWLSLWRYITFYTFVLIICPDKHLC